MKRILALLLTVIMMFGTLAIDIAAGAVPPEYVTNSSGEVTDEIDYEKTLEKYLTLKFNSEQEKLESMTMMYEAHGYQLWIDDYTGEVATLNLTTGQILFSNPYDIGSATGSDQVKADLFSQIVVKYTDNDTDKLMNSFEEAASRGQIGFEYIKNGIRVEYSIGREETRMLVPRIIERSRFENNILQPFADEINRISEETGCKYVEWRDYLPMAKRNKMIEASSPTGNAKDGNTEWFKFVKLLAFYSEKFLGEAETEKEKRSMRALYPICAKMDIWVCTPDISRNELVTVEGYIKTYIPSYTFEQLDYDHQLTEYEGTDKAPPLFKMALEYTLDEWGMSVRLPANGLRFDESLYQLTYVSILPYMGAGANYLLDQKEETFTGYNFFPDGAGTLFRHEELATKANTTINGKVYGQDYAYNTITGANQQIIRYPVFGIVSNTHHTESVTYQSAKTEEAIDADGNVIIVNKATGEVVDKHEYEELSKDVVVEEDKGFVAIIEEGDALAELSNYHMGSAGKYNTVQMLFYPRPKDSYNLANAISVGANATWTVVSSRKYVGNYKIRYIMLTDDAIAEENNITDYYECTWMGMAEAYRDYLYAKGELDALTKDDIQDDIPMYIETFGALETLEKIMSIPVNVMTSLTSFEDVKTMYDELSSQGVSNIKFKLTGYANGGMYSAVPYKLKWEKAVGGDAGYEDLLAYSAEKGFEVFPEFNFAYSRQDNLFDGLTLKKHIVKSINDTYMSRRYYSATRQTHVGRFELAISAAYFSHFYDKLTENLFKNYENNSALKAISVASLGTDLNSDFDEDEPYNREDSKKYTKALFEKMSNDYDLVMTDGANAYTWKYVDYIINAPLDSSRYNSSANAVPFIGVVLHGSVEFAGTPLNMEGNIGYSMLKAIENGAGLYFILCYDNYEELKEDMLLSEYYSVRYDILKDDVVKYYTILNDLTKDLQLQKIVGHKFLIGERVPDADEMIADEEALKLELEMAAKLEAEAEAKALQESLLEGRVYAAMNSATALDAITSIWDSVDGYYSGKVYIDENTGSVTVRIGIQTLVKDALAKAEAKNAMEDANALAKAWTDAYKLFTDNYAGNLTGNNKIYYDRFSTYFTQAVSLKNVTKTETEKKDNLEIAIANAVVAKLNAMPALVKAYDDAKAARDAITDITSADYSAKQNAVDTALANITTYVASLDVAREYATAVDLKTSAEAAMAAIVANVEETLKTAKAAYESAQGAIHYAGKVTGADYEKAYATLTQAKTVLTRRQSIANSLETKRVENESVYAEYPEYQQILDAIKANNLELEAAKEAVDAANKAIDEFYVAADPTFKAVKEAYEAAYEASKNYTATEEYLAKKAMADDANIVVEKYNSELTASCEAAYRSIIDEAKALKVTEQNLTTQLENIINNDAEYKAALAAKADAYAALEAIISGYVNDADYKYLVETLTDPIDAKIAEKAAKIKTASAEEQIKLANEIYVLMSVKYQKVKVPQRIEGKEFNVLLEVDKNADGFVIGGGYIVNDYIAKYKKACESTEEYKAALTAFNSANSAVSNKATSIKNNKDGEYSKLNAEKTAATQAYNKIVIDNAELKTALNAYISQYVDTVSNERKLATAKAELDAATYFSGVDTFTAVFEAYRAAFAENVTITTDYTAATKIYNEKFSLVRQIVQQITTEFSTLNIRANEVNKALANAYIAKNYYHDANFNGVYSQQFLDALDAVYADTFKNTSEANSIIDKALAKFIETLEYAKEIIPNTNTDLKLTALRVEIQDENNIIIPEIEEIPEEETTEEEEDEDTYEYTKYTDDTGSIVYLEFENGTYFILNYNYYTVQVVFGETTHTLAPYGGVRVDSGVAPKYFSTTK